MKKVIERLNRVLAILLVAAMVVGSVPEMSLVARAEGTPSTDEASEPGDGTGENSEDTLPGNTSEQPGGGGAALGESTTTGDNDGSGDDDDADGGDADGGATPGESTLPGSTSEQPGGSSADGGDGSDSTGGVDADKGIMATGLEGGDAGADTTETTTSSTPSYKITLPDVTTKNVVVTIEDGAKKVGDEWVCDGKKDVTFTVSPNPGYKLVKTKPVQCTIKGGEPAEVPKDTDDDGKYAIACADDAINGDIVITVDTILKSFNVDGSVGLEDSQTEWDNSKATAEINYQNSCVTTAGTTETGDDKSTAGNTLAKNPITFKVENIAPGYALKTVGYKIGGNSKGSLSPDNDGIYTIPIQTGTDTKVDNITGDVTISVTLEKKTYKYIFVKKSNSNVDIKYLDSEGAWQTWATGNEISVDYGDTITFTVTPKEPAASAKAHKVRYVGLDSTYSASSDANKELTAVEGKYTREIKDVTASDGSKTEAPALTTFYVESNEVKDIYVKLGAAALGNTNEIDFYEVTESNGKYVGTKVTGTATSGTPTGTTQGDFVIKGTEGGKVVFAAIPAEGSSYIVDSVVLADTGKGAVFSKGETTVALVDASNNTIATGVYLYTVDLADVDGATAANQLIGMTVTTKINSSKANTVTFKLSGDSDAYMTDKINIAITDGGSTVNKKIGDVYETLSTGNITFTIATTDNAIKDILEVKKVYVKSNERVPSSDTYTINCTSDVEAGTKNINVEIEVKMKDGQTGLAAAATLTVKKGTDSEGIVELSAGGANVTAGIGTTYNVASGAKLIKVYATIKDGYSPEISYKNGSNADVTLTKENTYPSGGERIGNNIKYTFQIPTSVIKNDSGKLTVTVEAKLPTNALTINYTDTNIASSDGIVVTVGGATVTRGGYSSGKQTWQIPQGKSAVVTMTPNTNYKIISLKKGSAQTGETLTDGTGRAKVYTITNMDAAQTYTLATDKYYVIKLAPVGGGSDISVNEDGTQNINLSNGYTVAAYAADNTSDAVDIDGVAVTNKAGTDRKEIAGVAAGKKSMTFSPAGKDAGDTLKVTLTLGARTAEFTLKINDAITSVGAVNEISQDSDTEATYDLTVAPRDAKLDALTLEVVSKDGSEDAAGTAAAKVLLPENVASGNYGVRLDTTNKKLVVKTKNMKDADFDGQAEKVVKVLIVDKNLDKGNAGYVKKAITVKITKPAKALVAPKMTVINDRATDLTIGVRLESEAAKPKTGELWYEVKVTAATDTDVDAVNTFYVKKTNEPSQEAILRVNKNSSGMGHGKEWSYSVSARLIQTATAVTLTANIDVDTDLATSLNVSKVYKALANGEILKITSAMAFGSVWCAEQSASTKNPYYPTTLKLEQVRGTTSTTVYTGQKVAIAKLNFGGDATYTNVSASIVEKVPVVNSLGETVTDMSKVVGNTKMIKFTQADGLLYMEVKSAYTDADNSNTVVPNQPITGKKYTVRVETTQADNTYKPFATVQVNIVRGIDSLQIRPASNKIYKKSGAAASLNVTPVFNEYDDVTGEQPKTKKVDYKIVDNTTVDNGNSTTPVDVTDAEIRQYVTIGSNGKITVNKNYQGAAGKTFKVYAVASDYTGNVVKDLSETITISAEEEKIGSVKLARLTVDGSGDVTSIAIVNEANDITTKDLEGLQVVAFKSATTMSSYTADDLAGEALNWNATGKKFTNPSGLTFKSSNTKAAAVDRNGVLSFPNGGKTANNVTITVKTSDGGTSKATNTKTIKFNVGYAKPNALGLKFEQVGADGIGREIARLGALKNSVTTHPAVSLDNPTAKTAVKLTVVHGDNANALAEDEGYVNVSMKVENAKVIRALDAGGEATIVVDKEIATIKLTNKDGGAVQTFKIENPMAKAGTKLKAVKTTTKQIYNRRADADKITYTMDAKDKAYYQGGNLWVRVTVDETDAQNARKTASYGQIRQVLGLDACVKQVGTDGKFEIDVPDGNNDLTAGSYKLVMSFGTFDAQRTFKTTTEPMSVTLKVANRTVKKVSYRVNTTLKMSVTDQARVELGGTANANVDRTTIQFTNLQNVNASGGVGNDAELFTTYFDALDANGDAITGVGLTTTPIKSIRLKNLTASQLDLITNMGKENKTGANARTAYITYSVNNEYGDDPVTGTVKITVSFTSNKKSLVTWSATGSNMLEGDTNAYVDVLASRRPSPVKYAYVTGTNSADTGFQLVPISMWNNNDIIESSRLSLAVTRGAVVKNKTYRVDVLIVPSGMYLEAAAASDLKNKFEAWKDATGAAEATAAAAYRSALEECGAITVKADIKVKAKDGAVKKINISANDLKVDANEWGYISNSTTRAYYTAVSYERLIPDAAIASSGVTVKSVSVGELSGAFSFTDGGNATTYTGNSVIRLLLDKARLEQADRAYNSRTRKTLYGSAVTVKAEVSYGTGVKTDTFDFKLTLPKKESVTTYAAALTRIQANVNNIKKAAEARAKAAGIEWDTSLNGVGFGGAANKSSETGTNWVVKYTEGASGNDAARTNGVYGYIHGMAKALVDELETYAPLGCDMSISLDNDTSTSKDLTQFTVAIGASETARIFYTPTPAASTDYQGKDGKLTLNVTLTDTSAAGRTARLAFAFDIKLQLSDGSVDPYLLKAAVEQFITLAGTNTTYAKKAGVTYADIKADAIANTNIDALLDKYPTLKLSVEAPTEFTDKGTPSNKYYSSQPLEWLVKYGSLTSANYSVDTTGGLRITESVIDANYVIKDSGSGAILASAVDDKNETTGLKKKPTTDASSGAGYIIGVIHVSSVEGGKKDLRCPFVFTLNALDSDTNLNNTSAAGIPKTINDYLTSTSPYRTTNRATKSGIMNMAKALYNNPGVTLDWGTLAAGDKTATYDLEDANWAVKYAVVGTAGEIVCKFKLTKTTSPAATGEFAVTIPLEALKNDTTALGLLKVSGDGKLDLSDNTKVAGYVYEFANPYLTAITDGSELPSEAKTAEMITAVKDGLLKKANDELEGQPYIAKYEKKTAEGETDKDDFDFTPYTYAKDGKISYTIGLYLLGNKKLNGDSLTSGDVAKTNCGTVTIAANTTLSKDTSLKQTFKQAKQAIIDKLTKTTTSDGNIVIRTNWAEDTAANTIESEWASNVLQTGANYTATVVKTGSPANLKAELVRPTFSKTGTLSIEVTLVEKDSADTNIVQEETFPVTLTIAKLAAKNEDVAETELTTAVRKAAAALTSADIKGTATPWTIDAAKEKTLVDAASAAIVGSGYTVTKKTGVSITGATVNAAGTGTIVFTLAKDSTVTGVPDLTSAEHTVTFTSPKLAQTEAELKKAVENAIAGVYSGGKVASTVNLATAKKAIEDSYASVVKSDTYDVGWKTGNDAFKEIKNTDPTPKTIRYEGTLQFYKKGTSGNTPITGSNGTYKVVLTLEYPAG